MRNRFFLGLIALGLVAAGTFQNCKKDPIESAKDAKIKGANAAGVDLRECEKYTPNLGTLDDKLLLFTNYVNLPGAFPMPNIEVKEAVWFMETFFNLGICEKQREFVEHTHSKKSYQFVTSWEYDNSGDIVLHGENLQTHYRTLLATIVEEILPEYALNFGDVYVKSIDDVGKVITFGMDVHYGQKSGDEFDIIGRKKIIQPNFPIVFYPFANPPDKIYISSINQDGTTRDPYMEALLNNEIILHTVTSVVKYDKWKYSNYWPNIDDRCDGSGAAQGSCDCPLEEIHLHGMYYSCPMWDKFILLTKSEYIYYVKKYRDYIYANLCNNLANEYPGYSPYLAGCKFKKNVKTSTMDYGHITFQDFGLEYICIFGDFITVKEIVVYQDPCFEPYSGPISSQ